MNFYNPFRAHIARFSDGTYAVRSLALAGWQMLGRDEHYWWCLSEYWHHAKYDSEADARKRLAWLRSMDPKAGVRIA